VAEVVRYAHQTRGRRLDDDSAAPSGLAVIGLVGLHAAVEDEGSSRLCWTAPQDGAAQRR
jgi:hypothetical protein